MTVFLYKVIVACVSWVLSRDVNYCKFCECLLVIIYHVYVACTYGYFKYAWRVICRSARMVQISLLLFSLFGWNKHIIAGSVAEPFSTDDESTGKFTPALTDDFWSLVLVTGVFFR